MDLTARIERHKALKPDIRGRRQLVSTLRRAGFPTPDPFTGEVLAALARAGVFRLRACLVGTVAYQSYSALLGVRLPSVAMRAEDLDLAQFHGIAVGIGEAAEPLLEALREVDPSFAPIPSLKSPMLSNALTPTDPAPSPCRRVQIERARLTLPLPEVRAWRHD